MELKRIDHVALIVSDYQRSKRFYTEILGLMIEAETWRENKQSWKLDLRLTGGDRLELFSFPDAPPRPSYPEAQGLRHLAFEVADVNQASDFLRSHDVDVEPVRVDSLTGRQFTFFADPDGLPLELYQR